MFKSVLVRSPGFCSIEILLIATSFVFLYARAIAQKRNKKIKVRKILVIVIHLRIDYTGNKAFKCKVIDGTTTGPFQLI